MGNPLIITKKHIFAFLFCVAFAGGRAFAGDPSDGLQVYLFRPEFKLVTPSKPHKESTSQSNWVSFKGIEEISKLTNVKVAGDAIYFGRISQEVSVDEFKVSTPRIVFELPEFNFHTMKFGKKRVIDNAVDLKTYKNVNAAITTRRPILLRLPDRIVLQVEMQGRNRKITFGNRKDVEDALCAEVAANLSVDSFDKNFANRFSNLGIPSDVMGKFISDQKPKLLGDISKKLQEQVRTPVFLDRMLSELDRSLPVIEVNGEKIARVVMVRTDVPVPHDEDSERVARVTAWRLAGEKADTTLSEAALDDLVPPIALANNNAVSVVATVDAINRAFAAYAHRVEQQQDSSDPSLRLPKDVTAVPELSGLLYSPPPAAAAQVGALLHALDSEVPASGNYAILVSTSAETPPVLEPWFIPSKKVWKDYLDLKITVRGYSIESSRLVGKPHMLTFNFEMNPKGLLKLVTMNSSSGVSEPSEGNPFLNLFAGSLKWFVLQGLINSKMENAIGTAKLPQGLGYESVRFLGRSERGQVPGSFRAEAIAIDALLK